MARLEKRETDLATLRPEPEAGWARTKTRTWPDQKQNQNPARPEPGPCWTRTGTGTRSRTGLEQTFSYLPQLQMVPVVRDEGQNLVQLKVLLLAADGQVVEDQVDQVHPAEGKPLNVLRPFVAWRAKEEVEPEEKQVSGQGSASRRG